MHRCSACGAAYREPDVADACNAQGAPTEPQRYAVGQTVTLRLPHGGRWRVTITAVLPIPRPDSYRNHRQHTPAAHEWGYQFAGDAAGLADGAFFAEREESDATYA